MDQGTCRLCCLVRPLANSHILPEWGYGDIYDPRGHRGYALSADPGVRLGYVRKGIREPLLCLVCEGKLSRYEHYARHLLTDPTRLVVPPVGQHVPDQAEYRRFKLFQLSILWRAHVATDRLFRTVDLGPHAERLRQMLYAEQPGAPTEYPCVLGAMYLGADRCRDLILGVIQYHHGGHHRYVFTYAGFIWTFLVSNHAGRHPLAGAALQADGTFITFAFDMLRSEGFKRFSAELVAANRQKLDRMYPP